MRIAPILQAERRGRYIEMAGSSGKSGLNVIPAKAGIQESIGWVHAPIGQVKAKIRAVMIRDSPSRATLVLSGGSDGTVDARDLRDQIRLPFLGVRRRRAFEQGRESQQRPAGIDNGSMERIPGLAVLAVVLSHGFGSNG